ncbi:MAG: DUF3887 domain-containing protein [Terriglobales bacterium]
MKGVLRLGTLCLLLTIFGLAQAPDYVQIGRQTVEEMASGKFAAVEQNLDVSLARDVPEQVLQMVWMHVQGRFGTLQKIIAVSVVPSQGQPRLVHVSCEFAKGPVVVNLWINPQGKIANLHFQ